LYFLPSNNQTTAFYIVKISIMQQTANMKDPVSLYIKLCDSTHYATNLRVKHILYPAKYNVRQADTL
jgi:hypothetical protein